MHAASFPCRSIPYRVRQRRRRARTLRLVAAAGLILAIIVAAL
jgi:hypothetical protein